MENMIKAGPSAEQITKLHKTKDYMPAPSEYGYSMALPVEEIGIFRQGWKSDELAALNIVYRRQSNIESGTLAVVKIGDDEKPLLKRVYKTVNGYVLEAPKNLDKPNEHIPPIAFTTKEAEEKLTILGKVVQFNLALK